MLATAVLWAVALLLAAALYVRRWRAVRRREPGDASAWRLTWLAGALLALAAALVYPFPALAQEKLTLHVAQHILVFDVAPILVVVSLTAGLLAPLAPLGSRIAASRLSWILHPYAVIAIYVATLWLWHVPPLYDLALEAPAVHVVQHVALLAAGTLFWWLELSPPAYRRTGELAGVLHLVGAKLLTGTLATVLILAPSAIYAFYERGLGPAEALDDQRMGGGGLILVEGMIFIVAVTAVFIRMLGESGHDEVDEPA